MFALPKTPTTQLDDPPIARFLFGDTRMAWFWLPIRLWLGWQWIDAASHKIFEPKWVDSGVALKGFWEAAVKVDPKPVIAFDWYRGFLQFLLDVQAYTWFGKLIAYGELLIGVALILGAFVGITAFFGGLMNWSFVMAGTASTNPLLLVVSIVLILAWKNAGYLGLDHYLLPLVGAPWQPGQLFDKALSVGQPTPQPTSAG